MATRNCTYSAPATMPAPRRAPGRRHAVLPAMRLAGPRRGVAPAAWCGPRPWPAAATRTGCWPAARDSGSPTSTGGLRAPAAVPRRPPGERLNVADTVKVLWQAYLGAGRTCCSPTRAGCWPPFVADTSRAPRRPLRHSTGANTAPYGDGSAAGPSPAGPRTVDAGRRQARPGPATCRRRSSLFQGVRADSDGALEFDRLGRRRHRGHAARRAAADRADRQCRPPARPAPEYTSRRSRSRLARRPPTAPRRPAVDATPEGRARLPEHRRRTCAPGDRMTRRSRDHRRRQHHRARRDRPARAPWSAVVPRGRALASSTCTATRPSTSCSTRADDHDRPLQRPDTVAAQRNIFLTTGSVLRTDEGTPLMTIIADDVRHTTPSAAPARRSPTPCATATTPAHQHACVENFLTEGAR